MDAARIEKALGGSENVNKAVNVITEAIGHSFVVDGARMTESEVKHRFDLCLKILGSLRHDLKWSLIRAFDMLPHYLRCELMGIAYDPASSGNSLWAPTDGTEALRA